MRYSWISWDAALTILQDFLANELQNQFEKLSNQARFVQMIVNKELSVSNKKKIDIVAELRKLGFRPFPKVSKAKAAGELEEVVQAEDEEASTGASSDYDYLLGMAIWSLTREKIEKLLQQAADKEQELMAPLELTPISIWNTDLDEFLSRWSVRIFPTTLYFAYQGTHHLRLQQL